MVLTPSGSWGSGSAGPPGWKSPCGTRGCSRSSGEPSLTFSAEDNVGSPYCVRRYAVDRHLGGPKGLAAARKALARRGLRLILDFVPNHVAPDHLWVIDHPEYFIRGDKGDLRRMISVIFFRGWRGTVFACGRDPYFPAWPDVFQLNAFQPGLRQAVIGTLSEIAEQCDGVRCDMAMLMLNNLRAHLGSSRGSEARQRLLDRR